LTDIKSQSAEGLSQGNGEGDAKNRPKLPGLIKLFYEKSLTKTKNRTK
jgi:hypothetical protein